MSSKSDRGNPAGKKGAGGSTRSRSRSQTQRRKPRAGELMKTVEDRPKRSTMDDFGEQSDVFELSDSQIVEVDDSGTQRIRTDISAWGALRDSYRQELDALEETDTKGRGRLIYELGRIEEEVSRDMSAATKQYRQAAELYPELGWSLRALRRRYMSSGSWKQVQATLEKELEWVGDEPSRASIWEWIGRIGMDRRTDTKGAAAALRKAIELDPGQQTAWMSLGELGLSSMDARVRVEALVGISEVTADPDYKATTLAEAGFVTLLELRNQKQATELFQRAVTANPMHESARLVLERLLHLEQRWADLVDLLLQEADLTSHEEINFSNRILAGWYCMSRLGDLERAALLFEQASALRPDNILPLWELTRIYHQAGRWPELVLVLERLAEQAKSIGPAREVAAIQYRLGLLKENRLGDPVGARDHYRRAIQAWPAEFPARRALAGMCQSAEDWQGLAELLLVEMETQEDPRLRAAAALRLADLMEHRLGDLEGATRLYEAAWEQEQGKGAAFSALDRIYSGQQAWDRLSELLAKEIEQCGDEGRRTALIRRRARILEERIGDREQATALMAGLPPDASLARERLMDLARLHEQLGDWNALEQDLVSQAELSRDSEERCWLLCRAAGISEDHLSDERRAERHYRAALALDSGYLAALAGLGRILHRQGRWKDLVDVYRLQEKTQRTQADAADILYRMGMLQETKLADVSAAVQSYQEALARDPGHVPALDALRDLLVRSNRWDDYLSLLDHMAKDADPVKTAMANIRAGFILRDKLGKTTKAMERFERAASVPHLVDVALAAQEQVAAESGDWKRLLALYDRAGELQLWDVVRTGLRTLVVQRFFAEDRNAARRNCLRVLEEEAGNREALWSLVELSRKGTAVAALSAAVDSLASAVTDPKTSVALLKQKIAWLGMGEEGRADGQTAVCNRILEFDPADRESLEILDRAAVEAGDDALLADICHRDLAHVARSDVAAAAGYVRLGDLLWRQGMLDDAARAYERARELHDKDLPAVRGLRIVRQLQGRNAEVADLLLEEAVLCRDRQAATSALMKAGDIWLIEFLDPEKAERAYRQVFDLDQDNALAFDRLVSLMSSREAFEELAALYKTRLERAQGKERHRLLMELADIYEQNLDDAVGAVTAVEEVLAMDAKDRAALERAAKLYGVVHRWRDTAHVLSLLVEMTSPGPQRAQFAMRLARVYQNSLGEEEKALLEAKRALQDDPGRIDALELAADVAVRLGRWEEAVGFVGRLAEKSGPLERARWLMKLAEIMDRGMGQAKQAAEYLVRAAALCLLAPEAIVDLERLFEEHNDPEGYDRLIVRVLQEAGPDMPGTTALRISRARNLANRLLRGDEAEREVQRAIEEDPESVEARLLMAALHLWAGREGLALVEYKGVLRREPRSHEAYRGLSQVFDRRGEKDRAALACQVLSALGRATEEEEERAEAAAKAMEETVAEGVLTPDVIAENMSPAAEPEAARALLLAAAPYLSSVFDVTLDGAGLGGAVPVGPDHPFHRAAARMARLFGLSRFDIFSDASLGQRSVVIPYRYPVLVVGRGLLTQSNERMAAFFSSRAWAQFVTGSAFLDWVELHELELTLTGLVNQFDREFGLDVAGKDELVDRGKSVLKAVPRKARKGLEEPAVRYAQAGAVGMTGWRDAAFTGASRVGLCCCGDLRAALEALTLESVSEEEQTGLMVYNVGSRIVAARRICGVSES